MDTLFKSCGIADLIASSNGGRNRLCSATFAKRIILQSNDKFFGSFNFNDDNKLSSESSPGRIFPTGQPIPKDPWQTIEDAASELVYYISYLLICLTVLLVDYYMFF